MVISVVPFRRAPRYWRRNIVCRLDVVLVFVPKPVELIR
jgi:hypothetical protein